MTTETEQLDRHIGTPKLLQPPADPLLAAIPLDVRDDWRKDATPELIHRLEVLCACGPRPSDSLKAMRMMHFRAVRVAWDTYVYCAFACGHFEGHRGKDLRGRLASKNPDDFRSAMAECLVAWFLAGKLRFPVTADAPGRPGKVLDMQADIGNQAVGVEVKAPYRERPPVKQMWYGHDGKLLAQCLESANKQFADDVANLLVLVPQLRIPVSTFRTQLVAALYGEEKITCPIDTRTGDPAGPIATKFFPEGRLLRRRQPSGAPIKPDGMPGFTRVSAVIVIEKRMEKKYPHPITALDHRIREEELSDQFKQTWRERYDRHYSPDNCMWVDHDVLIAHNPHAQHALSPDLFSVYIQFRDLGTGFGWSDGAGL